MSFDGTEAALAALQAQDSTTSLPLLDLADPAGPLLDAAMLADAGAASAVQTEAAAVMTAPAEDAGEALVAILMGTVDAPSEAPARTETNSDTGDYDLASLDLVLPEDEEFLFDYTSQSNETIIVTGTRVRLYFMPAEPASEPPLPGDTTVIEPDDTPPHPDAGYYVYEIIATGLKLRIPEAEWNALSQTQKDSLFMVLNNYHKSSDLSAALQHLVNEGVSSVEIRFGPQGWNHDGTNYQFLPNALAQVSSERLNASGTDLAPGSKVVISFNSNDPLNADFYWFGSTVIHELLHPFVPDTLQPNGQMGDHDRVDPMTDRAWNQINVPGA